MKTCTFIEELRDLVVLEQNTLPEDGHIFVKERKPKTRCKLVDWLVIILQRERMRRLRRGKRRRPLIDANPSDVVSTEARSLGTRLQTVPTKVGVREGQRRGCQEG